MEVIGWMDGSDGMNKLMDGSDGMDGCDGWRIREQYKSDLNLCC